MSLPNVERKKRTSCPPKKQNKMIYFRFSNKNKSRKKRIIGYGTSDK